MFALNPGSRLQVVVAHPDDETFGCGSVLLLAADHGVETAVCCATLGEAGEVAAGVDVPAEGLGALREGELREAARRLGVGRVDLLGLGDSGMEGAPGPGTLVGTDPEEVRDAVAAVVRDFAPDTLLVLDGGDGHRDHLRIREVTVALGAELGIPVYLLTLPRSLIRRWAEHMQRVDPANTYLHLGELGTPDEEVTDLVDVAGYLQQRWHAIRAHRSQRSPFEELPEELERAFLCTDHLIRT